MDNRYNDYDSSSREFLNVFIKIVREYGTDILADGKRLRALISDLMPGNAVCKNVFNTALATNIALVFLEAQNESDEQCALIAKRAQYSLENDYGISKKWSSFIVDCFISALGWKKLPDEPVAEGADTPFVTDTDSVASNEENTTSEYSRGDSVFFGVYRQTGAFEPIEWKVLKVLDDGRALLMSKYALDCKPYNTVYESVHWEECSLRKWLNGEFLDKAFTFGEKHRLESISLENKANLSYRTDAGDSTDDIVFLLSLDEIVRLTHSNEARKCKATVYAQRRGVYVPRDESNCSWWLRSPGSSSFNAVSVHYMGAINEHGTNVNVDNLGVRPCIIVKL